MFWLVCVHPWLFRSMSIQRNFSVLPDCRINVVSDFETQCACRSCCRIQFPSVFAMENLLNGQEAQKALRASEQGRDEALARRPEKVQRRCEGSEEKIRSWSCGNSGEEGQRDPVCHYVCLPCHRSRVPGNQIHTTQACVNKPWSSYARRAAKLEDFRQQYLRAQIKAKIKEQNMKDHQRRIEEAYAKRLSVHT